MVNKIPPELDGPIDNLMYNHIDETLHVYKYMGLTPNLLTTISLILGLLSVYSVYKDYYTVGALLWIISYYYDCADGKMARKYKMTSKFGDKYDHISDLTKTILLIIIMYYKLRDKSFQTLSILGILVSVFFLGSMAHMGCMEQITSEETSEVLSSCKLLIFGDCYKQMKYTKYLTTGSLSVLIGIIIYITPDLD